MLRRKGMKGVRVSGGPECLIIRFPLPPYNTVLLAGTRAGSLQRAFGPSPYLSSALNQRMLTLGRSSLYKHDSRESGAK